MVANLSAAITSKVLISRPSFGADWLHSGYTILLYSHNVIYARRGDSEPIAMNHSCISHPYLRRASIEILIAMVTQHCEDLTAYFFKFASGASRHGTQELGEPATGGPRNQTNSKKF